MKYEIIAKKINNEEEIIVASVSLDIQINQSKSRTKRTMKKSAVIGVISLMLFAIGANATTGKEVLRGVLVWILESKALGGDTQSGKSIQHEHRKKADP
jgi:predicted membrane protein